MIGLIANDQKRKNLLKSILLSTTNFCSRKCRDSSVKFAELYYSNFRFLERQN